MLGYESGDEAFAYPINILNFHEMVNDVIGGDPVLITYCPLCVSGVVSAVRLTARPSHSATRARYTSRTW